MHIVDVIPLSRTMNKETLSYFTAKTVSVGDTVLIPLRNKEVPGIVVDVKTAEDLKSGIKDASFGLKKISAVRSSHFFLPAFISAAKDTARHFVTGVGAVLHALTPVPLLRALAEETLTYTPPRDREPTQSSTVCEKYILQAPEKERFATYKSLIREEFAKSSSVIFLVPTVHDIAYTTTLLERGIEEHTYIFHGQLPAKTLITTWNTIIKNPRPVLIVGTASCLSIPRHDVRTIIIENEYHSAYKSEYRPFIDIRTFAEYLTQHIRGKLIFSGSVLRMETLYRRESEEFLDFSPPSFHTLSSAEQSIVDMRETHSSLQLTPKTFTVISDELKRAIEHVRKKNEHAYLFVPRRGLFTFTLCSDSGTVVVCTRCKTPILIHKETKKDPGGRIERTFLCHTCKEKNIVKDRCSVCDSWRLTTLGVGSERVEEEVKKMFPTLHVFRLDKDSAGTPKKAAHIVSVFLNSPGAVMVGTEMALNMLKKKIAVVAAVSVDSLLALPSFRMNEKAFILLMNAREKAMKKFIIQSRMPELSLFRNVLSGNIAEFFKEEKAARKLFAYPPFSTLVKLTIMGTKQALEQTIERVREHLPGYEPFVFPAFRSKIRTRYVVHALIKIQKTKWPDERLLTLLYALPPSVAINIDPEHLL